jgi:hypothetical protein
VNFYPENFHHTIHECSEIFGSQKHEFVGFIDYRDTRPQAFLTERHQFVESLHNLFWSFAMQTKFKLSVTLNDPKSHFQQWRYAAI